MALLNYTGKLYAKLWKRKFIELEMTAEDVDKLVEENKQLIKENEEMKVGLGCDTCQIHLEYMHLNQTIAKLRDENTEAKQIIKEFTELCQNPTWFLSKPEITKQAETFLGGQHE